MAERLEELVPESLYAILDSQNPSGIIASSVKREAIVELAEGYDGRVVEDGPYRVLRYWGSDLSTVFSVYPKRILHLPASCLAPDSPRLSRCSQRSDGKEWPRWWRTPTSPLLFYLEALLSSLAEHLPQAQWDETDAAFFVKVTSSVRMPIEASGRQVKAEGPVLTTDEGFFPQDGGERFLRLPFAAPRPEEIREGISRPGKAAGAASSLGA